MDDETAFGVATLLRRAIGSAQDKSNAQGNRALQTQEPQQRLEIPNAARFAPAASSPRWQGKGTQWAPARRLTAGKYVRRRLRPAGAAECNREAAHQAAP